jgi:hypothetical protein
MGLRDALAAWRERTASTQSGPRPELLRARSATSAKRWSEASEAWREVLDLASAGELGPEPWVELGRAYRLDRDLDAALRVVEEGRQRFPDDLGLTVEHARIALRGYALSEEDERHRWKARLLGSRRDLRLARERGQVSKPALHSAGEIELVLRRWDEAVELWDELGERYPDRRDEALLKRATALRSGGDLGGARAALSQVSSGASESQAFRKLDRAIAANERMADADAAFARLSARWHGGRSDVLLAELPEAILERGTPPAQVGRLRPLLEDLADLIDAADRGDLEPPAEPAPELGETVGEARDTVLVSGFLYSGSGAVFDLLRGYDRFHLPFEDKETGFLKKPGHLATIVEERHGRRHPDPATVVDAILCSGIGFGQTGRPLLRWVRGDDDAADRLVSQLRWLVRELRRVWARFGHEPDLADPPTWDATRRLLDAVVADRTPTGHTALLNNAVVGHQLGRLRLLSRSVAVPVLRDPRDQYVSQKLESPYAMACDDFVTMMEDRYRALAGLLEDRDVGPRLVPLRFERFVEDPAVRAALMDRLGVTPAATDPPTFRAERSRENIAIHRSYPDPEEIAHVSERLLAPFEELTGLW